MTSVTLVGDRRTGQPGSLLYFGNAQQSFSIYRIDVQPSQFPKYFVPQAKEQRITAEYVANTIPCTKRCKLDFVLIL